MLKNPLSIKKNIVTFRFIFSENPLNFDINSILVINGIKKSFKKILENEFTLEVQALENKEGNITVKIQNNIYDSNKNFNIETVSTQAFDTIAPTLKLSVSSNNISNSKTAKYNDILTYHIESSIDLKKPIFYIFDEPIEVMGSGKNWTMTYRVKSGEKGIPKIKVFFSGLNFEETLTSITDGDDIFIDSRILKVQNLTLDRTLLTNKDKLKININFNKQVLDFKSCLITPNASIDSIIKMDDNLSYVINVTPFNNIEDITNVITLKSGCLIDSFGNILSKKGRFRKLYC